MFLYAMSAYPWKVGVHEASLGYHNEPALGPIGRQRHSKIESVTQEQTETARKGGGIPCSPNSYSGFKFNMPAVICQCLIGPFILIGLCRENLQCWSIRQLCRKPLMILCLDKSRSSDLKMCKITLRFECFRIAFRKGFIYSNHSIKPSNL